ncbi:MAG TPA: GDSL-type esterase/lipase family protein [Mucilaginibacter sp.]|jgi:lysophospholipase L1-like esterase|nr:GDSL-type esterase/lipase family protein [Mucilaginibacter sp.]
MIKFMGTVCRIIFISTLTIFLGNSVSAQSRQKDINLVFIGNSITYGSQLTYPEAEAPPVIATKYMMQKNRIGRVSFANQGHSGYTTVDFLPSTSKTFSQVEAAAKGFANKQALLIFSIDLGTNDSAITGTNGAPVSPEHYGENLKKIIDALLKEFPGCVIVIQRPTWYSANTYNGAKYLAEGLNRLQSYFPVISHLVAAYAASRPKQVFKGDTRAFGYFKAHYLTDLTPEQGHQGTFYLHPNKKGAAALGTFWGESIFRTVRKLRQQEQ